MIFVDTNILIEYLKGDTATIDKIGFENICVSDIILMELYQGAKNKSDLAFIKKSLAGIYIVATDNDIISLAKNLLELYNLSHNAKIYDCIIASTTIIYDLKLLTYNKKDFQYIDNIRLVD
ncbi:MAG: type II toxin-antitoxin system VapC family toxin [Gammaproteobacteria bacterium]|nr:MAG: type II toxin-antitoxin system VapC family toxin [Gammaproteobacteria bacterium]